MKIKSLFKKKEKTPKLSKEQKFIEEEFKRGNVVLPTDIRDYEDFESFKIKTKDIPEIQERLTKIEENYNDRQIR